MFLRKTTTEKRVEIRLFNGNRPGELLASSSSQEAKFEAVCECGYTCELELDKGKRGFKQKDAS